MESLFKRAVVSSLCAFQEIGKTRCFLPGPFLQFPVKHGVIGQNLLRVLSGSMAQKFGGAFAGWAVMALLALFGYNTAEEAVQTPEALQGLKYLMSFIPAAIAAFSLLVVFVYPLNHARMAQINEELKSKRK